MAIASAAYGLGSQEDDGAAVARGGQSDNRGPRIFMERGPAPGFQELAKALRDFHEQHESARRDGFATALAEALGISADRVTAAFEEIHKRHEARFAAKLAESLGVGADEVQAALDKVIDQTPRPPDEFAQALADELGVDAADVRRALFEVRPDRGHRHRHPAMPLRQLASALDVSRAELRSALREVRAGAENGREEHKQALAKFLADRFDLDVDEVSDALGELPRPVPPGHGGRPGPGGPGAVGLPL